MNYFILSQDERISNAVEPVGIAQVIKKELLTIERMEELEELERQFPVLEKGEMAYTDLIEKCKNKEINGEETTTQSEAIKIINEIVLANDKHGIPKKDPIDPKNFSKYLS